MSKAKIKTADAPNNSYTIDVSGYGTVPAQCVTVDELVTGSEVNIIDQYNIPPDESLSFGNIRILPNSGEYTYSSDKTWKTADELWADNAKASLAKAFFFSCEENPRWQDEYPLYNIGTVTGIIDEKYMWVMCRNDVQRRCQTDYMSCDTGAFLENDQVVVKFENCDKDQPVVVGFWNEPKPCEFYIDITINGKQPEYIKTLKIVDKNDDEYIASSSEDDPTDDFKKPWKVGPFSGVVWPAKIYLENSGGHGGALFTYFTEVFPPAPEDPPVGYLVAKIGHDNYCKEEWGRSQLNCYFYSSYTPDGSEILAVPAEQVGYLLHGTFDSKPNSSIAFTTKVLGKLQTKSTGFSGCSSCSPASESFNWTGDADQIIFANNVSGIFPGSCRVTSHLEHCTAFFICTAAAQWNSYNSCSLNNMAIMTDEEGQNLVFGGATVSVGFFAWDVYCQEIDENGDWVANLCYAENVAVSDADNYEWKMLPTPEDRI